MADKEFNLEEMRRELMEAVSDTFSEEEVASMRSFPPEHAPDALNKAENNGAPEKNAPADNIADGTLTDRTAENAAEPAAITKEFPDIPAEDAAELPADVSEEIVAVTQEPLRAEMYEDIEAAKQEKALLAEQEAKAAQAVAALEAAHAAERAARKSAAGQAGSGQFAPGAPGQGQPGSGQSAPGAPGQIQFAPGVPGQGQSAPGAPGQIQSAPGQPGQGLTAAGGPANAVPQQPGRMPEQDNLAEDRDAITAAVMASHEKVALETEKQALKEVKKEKRRKKRRRTARNLGLTFVLLALVAGVAGGAYFYMVRYYATRFLSGTVINGKDVSGMTTAEVKQDLFGVTDTYKLTILERGGGTEELTSKQLGRSYIDNSQVETIMEEQENEKWLFHMNDQKVYEVSFDMAYDKKLASDAVNRLQCFVGAGITAPKDAKLSTNPDGTYYVTAEEEGNTLDEEKAKALIFAALDEAAPSVDLEEGDCYLKPQVYRDDARLNKRADAWNAYLSVDVTYSFGDKTETIDSETVRPYITDNGYDVILATDWVKTLVYAWGQKYDSFGLEREFTTHDGVTIKIPAGGDYGWCINKEKTIEDVTACILNGTKGAREPIWLFTAMGWDNNDITGTYCEVSIPDQHLWCYKDGVCVMDTDVVTGKPTQERMTFTGCYAIDGKKRDATLGRLDVQGYASPVSFWLPFNGGEGLHDAPWRSNFGGDIYKSNGSHGCVNIPKQNMETIFNALEIGNAVIVYDDKTPVAAAPSQSVQAESTPDEG